VGPVGLSGGRLALLTRLPVLPDRNFR